jgi:predicted short-subunit dehydrogenase-like oxidoreductase (DUF2520 family)
MKVVLLGSGNVATHMAKALKANNHEVLQVWSATFKNAETLALAIGAEPIDSLSEINASAEIIVIAVKDDAISSIVSHLTYSNALVVHTSGATDLSVLSGLKHYGVLYPLQTFSKLKEVDFKRVPLCIEASNQQNLEILHGLATSLSNAVYSITTEKRRILHLAAAFACNFVNQLYTLSADLLNSNDLDFDLLRPLIKETADKVTYFLPLEVQTGPAVRHDQNSLNTHLNLLQGQPELKHIYQTLSDSIKKSHQ